MPGHASFRGGAWGLLAGTLVVLVLKITQLFSVPLSLVTLLVGVLLGILIMAMGGAVALIFVAVAGALPRFFRAVLAGSLCLLLTRIFNGPLRERLVPTLYIVGVSVALGAGLVMVGRWRVQRPSLLERAAGIAAVIIGIGGSGFGAMWLLAEGRNNKPAIDAARATGLAVTPIAAADPSEAGRFPVRELIYGSGKDRRRPEYGPGVALVTAPVDGSAFIHGWRGFEGWARTRYWGFDASAMPINARVWYPDGAGPFPVVLLVHGGHPMQESSEPGYEYLGRLLASYGMIAASVDENFLNAASWQGLGTASLSGDNAARGYLLLHHLRALHGWGAAPGNPLSGKVDTTRVALVGHSRGGEAITAAATFNKMDRSPDDATIPLDFHFGIRALVAIATTDGQYQPGGLPTALADISFLALQGSNDGDVDAFLGAQQYERVGFTEPGDAFKATVFIHRASHGQWNRVWGQHDKSPFPRRAYFNRKPLLPEADQERVAKTYISAFLQATLLDRREFVPLFEDHRAGAAWLPDTIYVSRYLSAKARLLCSYDEDVDPSTATIPGGVLRGENLTLWREQPIGAASNTEGLKSRGVFLGWDDDAIAGVPSYELTLPKGAPIEAGGALVFALSDAGYNPNPRGLRRSDRRARTHPLWNAEPRQPIDLTVEVKDASGVVARVPLHQVSLLQPQIQTRVWKPWFIEQRAPEIVFQTFEIPFAAFVAASPGLDPGRLTAIRLVFDRTPVGAVVLNDVGVRPPR